MIGVRLDDGRFLPERVGPDWLKAAFVLDANEGVFPGTGTEGSLLPLPVRLALGLPTSRDKEEVAAYHFDMLAAGAKELHLFFIESGDIDQSMLIPGNIYSFSGPLPFTNVLFLSGQLSKWAAAPGPIDANDNWDIVNVSLTAPNIYKLDYQIPLGGFSALVVRFMVNAAGY